MEVTMFKFSVNECVKIPEILLPSKGNDLYRWAVIACDQFTSQPEYWDKASKIVSDSPSTINLIFPEVYLESKDLESQTKAINENMNKYISNGVFEEHKGIFIINRKTPYVPSRKGLIIAINLDCYDYSKGSKPLIRATEGTVIDRLPPRIKIRENAVIELPHVMLLLNDKNKTVIEPLFEEVSKIPLYETELMLDGGYISAYKIEDEKVIESLYCSLDNLILNQENPMLFAVGDGNHTLAAAKAHWENIKKTLSEDELLTHPARFALVEVCNLYDDGIAMHPIYRTMCNIKPIEIIAAAGEYFNKHHTKPEIVFLGSPKEVVEKVSQISEERHCFGIVSEDKSCVLTINNPEFAVEAGSLQAFLDDYLKHKKDAKIDYIHGEEATISLGTKHECAGFILPPIRKGFIFDYIKEHGVLPRKTFSIGEAVEKRYYIEARKIVF
jgi:hypothetical protein